MRIELINTGTELLLGEVINTHAAYVGEKLRPLGLAIAKQVAVPDGDAIRQSLKASRGSDVVVATGGLGPTPDDLTREIAAELYGLELHFDQSISDEMRQRLESRGHKMTENNNRQAMVPEGATVLPNPNGTAPGLYIPAKDDLPHLFLLPGPPRELYPMFENDVLSRILDLAGGAQDMPGSKTWTFYGLGESRIAADIGEDLDNIDGMAEVGYRLGKKADINLRCFGTDAALDAAGVIVEERFADQLISETGECMEEVVVRLLRENGATLATAESCTGGFLSHRVTNVSGSSEVFTHGFITYANAAKTSLLGVSASDLESHGAVSEPVAKAMAEGALAASGATCAVSLTGIAGPTGGTEDKPNGTVWIGFAHAGGSFAAKFFYPHEREFFKLLASQRGLDLVRRFLIGLPTG